MVVDTVRGAGSGRAVGAQEGADRYERRRMVVAWMGMMSTRPAIAVHE